MYPIIEDSSLPWSHFNPNISQRQSWSDSDHTQSDYRKGGFLLGKSHWLPSCTRHYSTCGAVSSVPWYAPNTKGCPCKKCMGPFPVCVWDIPWHRIPWCRGYDYAIHGLGAKKCFFVLVFSRRESVLDGRALTMEKESCMVRNPSTVKTSLSQP